MRFTSFSCLGMLFLAVLCGGCGAGGPEIAWVEGRVTMDGRPLPHAAIVFIPEYGRTAGARTDEQGRYVLNFTAGRQGAIPGRNRIRITTFREFGEILGGKLIPASPETVPFQYNAGSELEFVVKAGKSNVANFDLESSGPIQPPADCTVTRSRTSPGTAPADGSRSPAARNGPS